MKRRMMRRRSRRRRSRRSKRSRRSRRMMGMRNRWRRSKRRRREGNRKFCCIQDWGSQGCRHLSHGHKTFFNSYQIFRLSNNSLDN